MTQSNLQSHIDTTVSYLQTKQRVLFLTTSNRWSGEQGGEKPKSTQLAEHIASKLKGTTTIIDVPSLRIAPCEGNVSTAQGNTCGLKKALLQDSEKNPSGFHRCWASINNPDDELWKISKELFESDAVVFFGSIRWGQMNAYYQKLIERLTWIENRHSSLGEDNIIKDIDAGIIAIGQNWRGKEVVEVQRDVLTFYGFQVAHELCWNWQYTTNSDDEDDSTYIEAAQIFQYELLPK